MKVPLPESRFHEKACLWLGILLFLVAGGVILDWLLEWPRYKQIVGWDAINLSLGGKAIIFWLILAKTLACFVPALVLVALPIAFGRVRTAQVVLVALWAPIMYWLTGDILLMGFTGSHFKDYLPYLYDIILSPDAMHAQWAGEGLLIKAWGALLGIVLLGALFLPACRIAVSRALGFAGRRTVWLAVCAGSAAYFLIIAGIVPAMTTLGSPALLFRLYSTLPFGAGPLESLNNTARGLLGRVASSGIHPSAIAGLQAAQPAEAGGRPVVIENLTAVDLSLDGWSVLDSAGTMVPLSGRLPSGGATAVSAPDRLDLGRQLFMIDDTGQLRHQLRSTFEGWTAHLIIADQGRLSEGQSINIREEIRRIQTPFIADSIHPKPVDTEAAVGKESRPNVIIIVLESLNHAAMNGDLVKRLHAWSDNGLRLERHYSGSNCSPYGMFSLLYGRVALGYDRTLNAKVPPQLGESLKRSGYRCSYVTGGPHWGWGRMDEFLNDSNFDRIVVATDYGKQLAKGQKNHDQLALQPVAKAMKGGTEDWFEWPDTDRIALASARKILAEEPDKQHFVLMFLMSTHYPYPFYPRFEVFRPAEHLIQPFSDPRQLANRYRNSVLCLEDALMEFINTLDPAKNTVIITGDHGESLGEDGTYSHGTRSSEIQTRVPFMMVGPGINPGVIKTATGHMDVLPTLLHVLAGEHVPVKYCHGRDLLAGGVLEDTILVTPIPRRDQLVLIRGTARMSFKTDLSAEDGSGIVFEGLLRSDGLMSIDPVLTTRLEDAHQTSPVVEGTRKE